MIHNVKTSPVSIYDGSIWPGLGAIRVDISNRVNAYLTSTMVCISCAKVKHRFVQAYSSTRASTWSAS